MTVVQAHRWEIMDVTVLLVLLSLCAPCVWSAVVHVFVSPTGNDSNDGRSASHPVKTLQHVVSMLGQGGLQGNTVFVELMSGYHDLASTLHLQSTSGTVVFRAYQGQEVHVTGGKRLDAGQFHQVSDPDVLTRLRLPTHATHGHVLQLDLAASGLTDLGTLRTYGQRVPIPVAPMEISINGKPLILAEWPNRNYINIKSLPDGENGLRFGFDAVGRDALWANETEPWAYGYWANSYADFAHPLSDVDPHNHLITLGEHNYRGMTTGSYDPANPSEGTGIHQGGYFRVINMMSELDQPGEYYIDRQHKMLYLWPNTPNQKLTSSDVVYASMIDSCIKVERNAQHVHFEDFTLESCRHHGVELVDSRNVTLKNLEISNTGGHAVSCSHDCRAVSVLSSDIHDVNGGIFLTGGDRPTLTSSENVILDNHIWLHSRLSAFSYHGIYVNGVHATVFHNHVHHSQYTAIYWEGNEHVMEYNHLHHTCMNASDCGAFHSFMDWTFRGNIIRYNHVHDVTRLVQGNPVRAVMLDDMVSTALMEHNVFYDNDIHVDMGGGRDNVLRYNVMVNAKYRSVRVDSRGLGRIDSEGRNLRHSLQRSPYKTEIWKNRYPELYNILNEEPDAPRGNQIYNNVFYNKHGVASIFYADAVSHGKDYFDVHDDWQVLRPSDFQSPNTSDFRLRCDSAQWASANHFPIPVTLDQVGPTVPTGPHYLRVLKQTPVVSGPTAAAALPCDATTLAPAATPALSYLPDGSGPNTMFPHIPNHSCWLVTQHCASHPELDGTAEDTAGSQSGTEEGCLARAAKQFQHCGSDNSTRVYAVWGPTGATTLSSYGCFLFYYGCRDTAHAQLTHEYFSENHENASTVEENCLRRAGRIWRYCGSDVTKTTTAVFGSTGALRTAGAGCWIKIATCPADSGLEGYFFDAWGDTNRGTGMVAEACFNRGKDYWTQCGSHDNAPVTAFFRPQALSHTVP